MKNLLITIVGTLIATLCAYALWYVEVYAAGADREDLIFVCIMLNGILGIAYIAIVGPYIWEVAKRIWNWTLKK